MIDLNPGPLNGFPDGIAAVNGTLYFNGFDNSDFTGSKGWRSDGTAVGTSLLADTFPVLTEGGTFGPPLPGNFTALDATRYPFTALTGGRTRASGKPMEPDGSAESSNRSGLGAVDPDRVYGLRDVAYFAADIPSFTTVMAQRLTTGNYSAPMGQPRAPIE